MLYLIDGNAYINVAISVTKSILSRDKSIGREYYADDIFSNHENKKILKEQTRITFRDFCLSYLVSIIAPVHKEVDEVHIVFDSKSWRKEYISNYFKEQNKYTTTASVKEFKYKDRKKKDEHIHLFFEYFQSIISHHLKERAGINFHRIKGLEGDDILAILCKTISKNTVVYTVDKDMIQLVRGKEKYVVVIFPKQMSKHKKIYVPEVTEQVSETDFFNLDNAVSDSNLECFENTRKINGYVKYTIDCHEDVLKKIMGGDKSDNIPRLYKMTKSKVEKVCTKIKEKYKGKILHNLDELNEEFIEVCVNEMCQLNKIVLEEDVKDLREHLLLNIKLIRLSYNMLPENLKNEVDLNIINNKQYSKFLYHQLLQVKNKSVLI